MLRNISSVLSNNRVFWGVGSEGRGVPVYQIYPLKMSISALNSAFLRIILFYRDMIYGHGLIFAYEMTYGHGLIFAYDMNYGHDLILPMTWPMVMTLFLPMT